MIRLFFEQTHRIPPTLSVQEATIEIKAKFVKLEDGEIICESSNNPNTIITLKVNNESATNAYHKLTNFTG